MLSIALLATLALAAPPAARGAGVDRVPQDFATIQEAVDGGTSPVILVGSGAWAGATITRPVSLRGHQATIASGVPVGAAWAGFAIPGSGSGSAIAGFTFDCTAAPLDLGVFSSVVRLGSAADDVAVTRNRFVGCVQGVTVTGASDSCLAAAVTGGARWRVEGNVFDGFPTVFDGSFTGGGLGVFLFNASEATVARNRFVGSVQDSPLFSTAGVFLAGCWGCAVEGNRFAVADGTDYWSAIANFGAFQPGAAASRDGAVTGNDARQDSAPYAGINFQSYDSFAMTWSGNLGTTVIDHTVCGDGESDLYTTTNRGGRGRALAPAPAALAVE